jgi:hypothetical protein
MTLSSTFSPSPVRRTAWAIYATLAAWAGMVTAASMTGVLGRVPLPLFALLVAIGILAPTVLYFAVPRVNRWVAQQGLYRLTLLHTWRIPAALIFFWYGMQGHLPPLFWMLAGVGDLMAGVLACTVLWRPADARRIRWIHRFGAADFAVAVGTGLTFTLMADSRMAALAGLPLAMIPLFGVGISGATHVMAFDLLRKQAPHEPHGRASLR